jgi:subtilisin-like proprotein convertase family protein
MSRLLSSLTGRRRTSAFRTGHSGPDVLTLTRSGHRPRHALAALILTVAWLASTMPGRVAPPTLSARALRQLEVLSAIGQGRTPVEQKLDTTLHMGLLHQRGDQRLAPLTHFRFVTPDVDGRVRVDVAVNGADGLKPALDWLAAHGAPVEAASAAYQIVTTRLRFDDLEPLAALRAVRRIRRHVEGLTNQAPGIVSEGDATHGAAAARAVFGVTGAGVKVCVLSDGVTSLAASQASGELPAVDVLAGQAGGGDEGTAMLEIIHDLAPDAELGFATAAISQAQFAQNIQDLAAAGCDVMVDAYSYPDEPAFQDGPIAQALNTVTAAGVVYFSAAGDDGNANDGSSSTWEGDFNPNGTIAALAGGGDVHNFGDGGQSIQVTDPADQVVLTWAEHDELTGGLASTDFDLYVLDNGLTTIFDASTNTQDGDDRPVETMGAVFGNERIVVTRFAAGSTSSVPMFNLLAVRGRLNPALATSGAIRGHSAAAGAISVAATPAPAPGPFPGLFTSVNVSQTFTSDGPRRIILNANGSEITPGNRTSTGGVVRQKPDLTAADGVSTSVNGFAPFTGTSAAAPHAAAIAALMKSAVPTSTAAQLRTALIASAIDIEAPGVDRDTGAGIVMAQAALTAIGAVPGALLSAEPLVPTIVGGDGDTAIEPNEAVDLVIPLTNIGGALASGITATLSTATPGVTVAAAASTYPDTGASVTSNNVTPFRIKVLSPTCGSNIALTLTVTYSGGPAPQASFPFVIRVGGPGTTTTFSFTGPEVAIPDAGDLTGNNPGALVAAPVTVSGTGGVYDVDVRIDGATCTTTAGATTVGMNHTFISDLDIGLVAPNGASILLIDNADGSGNNLCQTLLDDESTGASIQTVVTAQAPFTGSFRPNAALSAFDAMPIAGTWELTARDFFSSDTGHIRAWSLLVTEAACDAPDQPPGIAAPPAQTTVEDQALGPIAFMVNDVLTAPEALIVTAASSNPAVVALGGLALGGSGATRTLTITPVANAFGDTTITLQVSDGTSVVSAPFLLTVTPVNDAPTLSSIAPQTIAANTATAALPITITDVETPAASLTLTGTSSNQALVADAGIVFGGAGTNRTVTIAPLPNRAGETTITVTVNDGTTPVSTSFVLTVTPTARRYFLAEGATGDFFDEDLVIANPNAEEVSANVTFYVEGDVSVTQTRVLPARSGTTLRVDAVPGLETASVSVEVTSESGLPLAVERTQFWDATAYGGHTESAVSGSATRWFFAEGAQGYFDTFVLVANPQAAPVDVTFTFLREGAGPVTATVPVAPFSRASFPASSLPDLANTSFAIIVDAPQPVVAERAMYFGSTPTRPWTGGAVAAGVTAPSSTWYFAEGATGAFFDTFLLLMNPETVDAQVTLRYLLDTGETIEVPKVVPAGGRLTVNVETESDARLHVASMATLVTSDRPIVAERSVYWPTAGDAQSWGESHTSLGVPAAAPRWALAEGRTGGALGFHTYVLLGNPGTQPAETTVEFVPDSGMPVVKTYVVPAMSRVTIDVTAEAPELQNRSFITLIGTTGDVPIVVERSMYWNGAGLTWSGGSSAAGTRLPE